MADPRNDHALTGLRAWANPQPIDKSNPFKFITDEKYIRDTADKSVDLAYAQKLKELGRLFDKGEDTQYAQSQNLLRAMQGQTSGIGRANKGAASANALQAILGLGMQGTQNTTDALNQMGDVIGQKAAAKAKNAQDAITSSNAAKAQQGGLATQVQVAQKAKEAAAAEAYAALRGTFDTNITNYKLGQEQIRGNKQIAGMTQKSQQTIYNK